MKLYIPRIEDILILKKAWTFNVWSERRNEELGYVLGLRYQGRSYRSPLWVGQAIDPNIPKSITQYPGLEVVVSGQCALPKGTSLKVDRIYIRKNAAGYDSVSFYILDSAARHFVPGNNMPGKKKIRFWAKLDDVNTMEIV